MAHAYHKPELLSPPIEPLTEVQAEAQCAAIIAEMDRCIDIKNGVRKS